MKQLLSHCLSFVVVQDMVVMKTVLFVMIIVSMVQQDNHETVINHQHQHAMVNQSNHRELKERIINRNVAIHGNVSNTIKIRKAKVKCLSMNDIDRDEVVVLIPGTPTITSHELKSTTDIELTDEEKHHKHETTLSSIEQPLSSCDHATKEIESEHKSE
jgi:hypothetical protein